VLPLALWAEIKATPGVNRFQAIQTGQEEIKIRLEASDPAEKQAVWALVQEQAGSFLACQGLENVHLVLAEEAPMRDARSGKFRHVWSEVKGV
jgi:hypothetical protein